MLYWVTHTICPPRLVFYLPWLLLANLVSSSRPFLAQNSCECFSNTEHTSAEHFMNLLAVSLYNHSQNMLRITCFSYFLGQHPHPNKAQISFLLPQLTLQEEGKKERCEKGSKGSVKGMFDSLFAYGFHSSRKLKPSCVQKLNVKWYL